MSLRLNAGATTNMTHKAKLRREAAFRRAVQER